ncbi:MAG TPA: hypothetical protein VMV11_05955 [Acidimicrobiales bacterium]|nr:hypothetical protein [Acidimicrobiales bacterium]
MRQLPSLKSTHWVIWSSPLLLLVMVFTLTTSSGSTPRRREALSPTTTTRAVTDPVTSKEVTTTSTTTPPTTLTTTTITKPVTETVVNAPAGPSATNAPHETNSSLGTVSSAKPVANAPAENASSGVLTGQLTPSFAVADVPLDGPGTWNVATSAASILTLRCANQSISVQAQFVIGAREQCQLILTPATTSTSLTWQLTPGN